MDEAKVTHNWKPEQTLAEISSSERNLEHGTNTFRLNDPLSLYYDA